jgi:hypothetical protein
MSNTWYYTWAVVLLLGNLGGFTATVFGLPGTWFEPTALRIGE